MSEFKIIGTEFISYTGGEAQIISNDKEKFYIWSREEDAQRLCDLLNGKGD